MNEDVINDFKQFITAAVSQQTVTLQAYIAELKQNVSSLQRDITRLDRKIDDISESIAEALDATNDATATQSWPTTKNTSTGLSTRQSRQRTGPAFA